MQTILDAAPPLSRVVGFFMVEGPSNALAAVGLVVRAAHCRTLLCTSVRPRKRNKLARANNVTATNVGVLQHDAF